MDIDGIKRWSDLSLNMAISACTGNKDLKQINLDSQPRLLTNSFKH